MYLTACIHTCATCQVHSHYELIKHATIVHIVREQLRCHQPLVHMLARSEYFPIRVVRALFHMRVFFKLKSSCTVYGNLSHVAIATVFLVVRSYNHTLYY